MTKMSTMIYLTLFSLMFLSLFILLTNSFNISSTIIILISYSLMTFFLMSFWSKNYLYSIMMFLTLISGLLIIFMYFTSLISNMMNNFSMNNMLLISTFMMNNALFIFMNYRSLSYLNFTNSNMFNSNLIINLNANMFNNIFFIYLYPNNNITLLSMLFLLLSMFMIIKMCSIKSSSLRKIN